jgi:hypothetical protein
LLGHRRGGGGIRRPGRVGDDHRAPSSEAREGAAVLLETGLGDEREGANAHDWLEVTGLTPLEPEPVELLVAPELVAPVELDAPLESLEPLEPVEAEVPPEPVDPVLVEPLAPLPPALTLLVVAVVADLVSVLRARAGS